LPMHEMTKDGFMFLVLGFSGAKAAAIKESYIAAFNMMEQALKQNTRIAPDMVAISNQEYIELLKTKIALLETKPTETRKRISPEEKQRIRQMRAAGLNSVEIGRQLNRPNESIRTILRKDGLL
jgi:phage regulator Rha-like protein